MSGFAHRPAGTLEHEVAGKIDAARIVVADLRHELGQLQAQASEIYRGGLVELDIGRALVALGAADLALDRGRRHARLEL